MYGVVRTRQFERAFRKLKKSGTLKPSLKREIDEMILTLAARKALDANYKDHQLTGEFAAYRDCHVRVDFLLVYKLQTPSKMAFAIRSKFSSQLMIFVICNK